MAHVEPFQSLVCHRVLRITSQLCFFSPAFSSANPPDNDLLLPCILGARQQTIGLRKDITHDTLEMYTMHTMEYYWELLILRQHSFQKASSVQQTAPFPHLLQFAPTVSPAF